MLGRLNHVAIAVKDAEKAAKIYGTAFGADISEAVLSRMANLGDVAAQSFYGHLLLFRGQGFGAREEGLRLLALAAAGGDAKAAYQLGVQALQGSAQRQPDGAAAARHWAQAAEAGHPLAARRLAELYRDGAEGLAADAEQAERYQAVAARLGL